MAVMRNLVFGEEAELYDRVRPDYRPEVVGEVLAYARQGLDETAAPLRAVEVGPGTGKATVAFAAEGVHVTAVEPDHRMAEVLRRRVASDEAPAGSAPVEVVMALFEDWRPDAQGQDLLFAAQAWHWLDPAKRVDLAHRALRPGGAVALLWNVQGVVDPEPRARFNELQLDTQNLLGENLNDVTAPTHGGGVWAADELGADARFEDVRAVRIPGPARRYSTEEWQLLLSTHSGVRILPPEQREALLTRVGDLIDAHGGAIDVALATDVVLARKRR